MENYLYGKTYRTLLTERQGRGFSEIEITEILRQVLLQLAQIHGQGLVHGGISPDTIIQDENSIQAKLIQPGAFSPPGYIAPEQIQTGQTSAAGDIYALGVTIIVLLTAQNPEVLRNYDDTWKWQDYCLVSDQLTAVLERTIAALPEYRYANAMQMLEALNPTAATVLSTGNNSIDVINSQTLFSPPNSSSGMRNRQNLTQQQWFLIGAGAILIVLASFGVANLINSKKEVKADVNSTPFPENNSLSSQPSTTPKPPPSSFPTSVETERVSFDAGGTGTKVSGRVSSTQLKRYLLDCGQGQRFSVNILQGNVNVAVIAPTGIILGTVQNGAKFWEGSLPSNGDYAVEISAPNDSNYTVSIDVL